MEDFVVPLIFATLTTLVQGLVSPLPMEDVGATPTTLKPYKNAQQHVLNLNPRKVWTLFVPFLQNQDLVVPP